ncbi:MULTISPECIES: hypothetical protein [Clostridium]|uniref:Uncharacterized protein n=1 Tax=Clostridium botulinum B str. Osaka05 TaxID=1407017 RepID=A0A0S6U2H9_CLOBO|nr:MULTISPECIES: hypothetical protein [Clostridium]MBY6873989.1 hypothetical protein [Clostridium botulinum]GAE00764.1 hypothetical protein CBO05C_0454 [Clostridium botulinum B str. Osaka05]
MKLDSKQQNKPQGFDWCTCSGCTGCTHGCVSDGCSGCSGCKGTCNSTAKL